MKLEEMEKYEEFTLDFTETKYIMQLHETIRKGLAFPDWYGKNWDAFWDCIRDMMGAPIRIEIYGYENLEINFCSELCKMTDILKEAKHSCNDRHSAITEIVFIINGREYDVDSLRLTEY